MSGWTDILFSDARSDRYGLHKKIHGRGLSAGSPPSTAKFSMLFIYGLKWGFNYLSVFPLTIWIGIGMEPDTPEWSKRRSQLLQVNSRPRRSFSVTNSGALIFHAAPFHRPTWPWAVTSCLSHMKFRDLALCISESNGWNDVGAFNMKPSKGPTHRSTTCHVSFRWTVPMVLDFRRGLPQLPDSLDVT